VHKNSKIRGIHMHYVRCGRSGGFAHIYLCINHVAKFLCLSLARRLSISRGVSYKRLIGIVMSKSVCGCY